MLLHVLQRFQNSSIRALIEPAVAYFVEGNADQAIENLIWVIDQQHQELEKMKAAKQIEDNSTDDIIEQLIEEEDNQRNLVVDASDHGIRNGASESKEHTKTQENSGDLKIQLFRRLFMSPPKDLTTTASTPPSFKSSVHFSGLSPLGVLASDLLPSETPPQPTSPECSLVATPPNFSMAHEDSGKIFDIEAKEKEKEELAALLSGKVFSANQDGLEAVMRQLKKY
jgi:hypothetical protein